MKKKTKAKIAPCGSITSTLKCVRQLGHDGEHSSSTAGRKGPQCATWSPTEDGRVRVTVFSRGKKTGEWFDDAPAVAHKPMTLDDEPEDSVAAAAALAVIDEEESLADLCLKCNRELGEHDGKKCPKSKKADAPTAVQPEAVACWEPGSAVDRDRLEHVYKLIVAGPGKDALALSSVHRRTLKQLKKDGRIEYRNDGWFPKVKSAPEPAEVEEIDDEPDDIDMRNLAREQRELREAHAAEVDAPTTALARVEGQQPGMLSVERARDFLAKSKSVDEVREVADKAKAVSLYLRSRDASIESQNDAAEIRLRAERRLGELTREQPKQQGARGVGKSGVAKSDSTLTYAEQGIDKRDAAKWQQIAKIPAKKFEEFVADTRAKGERLTANAPLKMVRQEHKAVMAAELRAKPIPQVTGRFDVIVIDPPWLYEKRAEDITQRGQIDYPGMELDTIKALPVADRAEDNCILWCWTTNGFMRAALECLDAWGFKEKTILTWGKDRMGNGDWLRGKTEHCIMAVRGSPIVTLTNQTTLLPAPVREHSRKPDEFYALVETLCPGTKLDMFAREAREGYVLWGAETEKFATEAA